MQSTPLLDSAGRRREPATTSRFHHGRAPRNNGLRYPPDPPTVEEIVAVMRTAWPELRGGAAARDHRGAMARRAAYHRGARPQRDLTRPEPWFACDSPR